MSSVLCRFSLNSVSREGWYTDKLEEAARVKFSAIRGEPFGPATPQGTIEMVIVNPSAAKVFLEAKLGTEFDVLLTPPHET